MNIFCKFPTVNISKLNLWLVIYIAKNLIWTILKEIFSICRFFLYPQIPDFQWICFPQTQAAFQEMFKTRHKTLTDGLESCGLLVDYCDVFIRFLGSHSDGIHSLEDPWWTRDSMKRYLHLGCAEGQGLSFH